MIISRVILKNWKNFKFIDVEICRRVFIVGPNASGKSNFLDAFRFLRDIAKDDGSLQRAVKERGGISKIRWIPARRQPQIEIEIFLSENEKTQPKWRYALGIFQETSGYRRPIVQYEKVWKGEALILNRPDPDDNKDPDRLTQTHLEQINANASFRDIVKTFESINYLHLVPQLLRHPNVFTGPEMEDDPFGRRFLEKIAETTEKTRKSRLRKIENVLQIAVPQLKELEDSKDNRGIPHLQAIYDHWRPNAGRQNEEQFSDGTLRLIGLLWSILESDSLLLLEEPELSLHAGIIRQLPGLIWRLKSKKKRQMMISTHSYELLSDPGIHGEETLMLTPTVEGTHVEVASNDEEIRNLLEGGLTVADAVIPKTQPKDIEQMSIIFNE